MDSDAEKMTNGDISHKTQEENNTQSKVRHLSARFENTSTLTLPNEQIDDCTNKQSTRAAAKNVNSKAAPVKTTEKSKAEGGESENGQDRNGKACVKCKNKFPEKGKGCEICRRQCCSKCLKLSPTKFETLLRDDVFWVCSDDCRDEIKNLIRLKDTLRSIRDLNSRLNIVEAQVTQPRQLNELIAPISDRVEALKETMKSMDDKIGETMKSMEDRIDNTLQRYDQHFPPLGGPSSWMNEGQENLSTEAGEIPTGSETRPKQLIWNTQAPFTKDTFMEAMKEKEKESQEREDRARNVIIFRAKESTETNSKKRIEHDEKYLAELMNEIELSDIEVSKVTRLGKKADDKKRPLKFTVKDLEQKAEIMNNLYKLGECNNDYKDISVQHDLTKDQREELGKMVESAKEQTNESDNFLFKVRSIKGPLWEPRIVRFKAQSRK